MIDCCHAMKKTYNVGDAVEKMTGHTKSIPLPGILELVESALAATQRRAISYVLSVIVGASSRCLDRQLADMFPMSL